jgi:hypothetical protein
VRPGMADIDDRTVLDLLAEALEVDPVMQETWLSERCGGNPALAARLRRLIAVDAEAEAGAVDPGPGPPPDRVGVYQLEALIGAGGMGSVYRARRDDGLFDQTVAIKFIRAIRGRHNLQPLIDAERRMLARMDHEGIARILDGGATEDGLHYLVMEFVPGVPLDDYADARGLSLPDRVRLVRQAAAALAHAHHNRIVHCDVKPSNILVTAEGRAKLIDFGVARLQEVVETGGLHGVTRAYASPERLERRPATLGDDVYSLAVTLYLLAAGRLPWPDLGSDVDRTRLDEEAPPLSDVLKVDAGGLPVEDLDAILAKALNLQAEARYRTIEEFDADLGRWLERRPVKARPSSLRYAGSRLLQRRPLGVLAGAGALATLVLGLVAISVLYVRSEEARAVADQRFGEVRSLAGFMLFDLNTQLEQTPGASEARLAMANRAQGYLDALAASAGRDAGLQSEAAVGLMRLAEVQGVPSRANLGLWPEARKNLDRAESVLANLSADAPEDAGLRAELGKARYFLAMLTGGVELDMAAQLKWAEMAEADLSAALEGLTEPAKVADVSVLLLGARLTKSDALQSQEKHAEALAIREAEEARILAMPEDQRATLVHEFQAGRVAALIGDSLWYLGRMEDALHAYERAATAFEGGLKTRPLHRKLLEGAVYARWALSGTLAELGRNREGLEEALKAEATARRLMEWDPADRLAVQNFDMASGQVTLMLNANGRPKEALKRVEDEIAVRRERLAAKPGDVDLIRSLAVPMRGRAEMLRGMGNRDAACRAYGEAREAWDDVSRAGRLSDLDRRTEVEAIREAMEGMACG